MSFVAVLLLIGLVGLCGGEKRGTEYLRRPADHPQSNDAPFSFSHISLETSPHHHSSPEKLPLLRVPVAVQVPKPVPVALVSPVPYYVEKPVAVKEVPVISKVPVHYLHEYQQLASPYHQAPYHQQVYHQLDTSYPQLQPYYKQYHALRSKDLALCRWTNSLHSVHHPLLSC